MGAMAYGRKVREDDASVSYTFSGETTEPEGVLVIPLTDPETWYVEGRDHKPLTALRVLGKAAKLHRLSGSWPDTVIFQS